MIPDSLLGFVILGVWLLGFLPTAVLATARITARHNRESSTPFCHAAKNRHAREGTCRVVHGDGCWRKDAAQLLRPPGLIDTVFGIGVAIPWPITTTLLLIRWQATKVWSAQPDVVGARVEESQQELARLEEQINELREGEPA